MSLGIARRSVRSLIKPHKGVHIPLITLSRNFHVTHKLLKDEHLDQHQEKINDEIRKLKQLKDTYKDASFLQKFSLRSKLMQQEMRIAEAQSFKVIDDKIKTPSIKFDNDPLDLAAIHRYQVVYAYMLDSFMDQCRVHTNNPNASVNPDTIIDEIIDLFKKSHKDVAALTKQEVLFYFHIYYSLLNNIAFLDELEFENDKVAKLLSSYSSMSTSEDLTQYTDRISKEVEIDADIVQGWFKIFDTLSSTPFADGSERYTNPICPYEYARFESFTSEVNALQDKLSQIYPFNKPEYTKELSKKFNFQSNGEHKAPKDSKQSKTDKDTKDTKGKKTIDFEINLNGSPMKYVQIGVLFGLVSYMLFNMSQESDHEISFQQFTTQFLKNNLVEKITVVNNRTAVIDLNQNGKVQYAHPGRYYFNVGSVESFERSLREVQEQYEISDSMRIPVLYTNEGSTAKLLINFLPTVLFLGAIYYMTKKAGSMGGMGGPLGFGKSTAKKFNQETDVKIRFKDVAGMSEAKEEVMEFVKFLQNPEKYEKLGAKIPRGAILSGPPGTGKTLIAKATAGEANVPFYSVSGSEFVEMFVGVGASRVRDLFKTARENAPSIVFVDEIDAIGKQRSKGNASGANDERETTLNQLLVEMDGFDNSDHVVVLAGTNRADILDKALMRPGRFDRHITIDNPELQGRKEIFQVHLKKITLAENIDKDLPGRLAALTPGFSGADIANVCNEAALIGARFNADAVTLRHFELAIERVIGGIEKKSKILNVEEQKVVAYHEAGHAVCGWYLKFAHPLLKVSIIPRGQGALGYAQYLPPDQYLMSTLQLTDRMIMTLGGRVSEELHFSSVTSGAHDDFKKVTNIAQSMVMRFGMSKKVGMVNYADTQSSENLTKPFSDETNNIIDEEIQRIVRDCYQKCTELLKERSHEVELVAQELLKKEFITREDMIRLLGKRPFPETNDAFDKYLDGNAAFKNDKPAEEKKDQES